MANKLRKQKAKRRWLEKLEDVSLTSQLQLCPTFLSWGYWEACWPGPQGRLSRGQAHRGAWAEGRPKCSKRPTGKLWRGIITLSMVFTLFGWSFGSWFFLILLRVAPRVSFSTSHWHQIHFLHITLSPQQEERNSFQTELLGLLQVKGWDKFSSFPTKASLLLSPVLHTGAESLRPKTKKVQDRTLQ
jgi:hypothetical protein